LGIKYYRSTHQNKFYKNNKDKTFEPKKYEEQLETLNRIFIFFNCSEYYFSKVVAEYPKSEWKIDAVEKIKLLKNSIKVINIWILKIILK